MSKTEMPSIRFYGFDNDWEQRKLSEITDKVTEKNAGLQYVETFTNSAEFGIISQRDFFDHDIAKLGSLDGYYIVKTEDFVYNPRISTSAPVGPINRNKLGRTGVMSPLYTVFRLHDIDTTYLEYFFKCGYWHSFMNFNGDSGARSDRFSIRDNVFFQMPIPIPDIDEQRKIGELLTCLDNLITLHQRKCALLFSPFQAFISMMFTTSTFSWEQRKLGDIADIVGGGTPSTGNQSYWDGDIDWYAPAEIADQIYANSSQKKITGLGYENSSAKMLPPGTVLFTSRAGIGKTAILTRKGCTNQGFQSIVPHRGELDSYFIFSRTEELKRYGELVGAGSTFVEVSGKQMAVMELMMPPTMREQQTIGGFFQQLDHLITLHQRKCIFFTGRAGRLISTVNKKRITSSWEQREVGDLLIERSQQAPMSDEYPLMAFIANEGVAPKGERYDRSALVTDTVNKLYKKTEKGDFIYSSNNLETGSIGLNKYGKACISPVYSIFEPTGIADSDFLGRRLVRKDFINAPTRKAIIKGKPPVAKKIKYLNQFELHTLLISLDLKDKVNWDYFILLVAKTGMRFSEALALTPKDFDFAHQTLSISKTWDYKGKGGFQPTKNKSSVRKIQIDWQTVIQFSELVKHLPEDKPIFVNSTVYNSTVNDILGRHCKACNIPVISIHGLRHTHASLLLFTGVSIASVARRLGHSSMTTTQKTYLHIIQELENKDIDLVMRSLSGLS